MANVGKYAIHGAYGWETYLLNAGFWQIVEFSGFSRLMVPYGWRFRNPIPNHRLDGAKT